MIISRGRVVAAGAIDELKARVRPAAPRRRGRGLRRRLARRRGPADRPRARRRPGQAARRRARRPRRAARRPRARRARSAGSATSRRGCRSCSWRRVQRRPTQPGDAREAGDEPLAGDPPRREARDPRARPQPRLPAVARCSRSCCSAPASSCPAPAGRPRRAKLAVVVRAGAGGPRGRPSADRGRVRPSGRASSRSRPRGRRGRAPTTARSTPRSRSRPTSPAAGELIVLESARAPPGRRERSGGRAARRPSRLGASPEVTALEPPTATGHDGAHLRQRRDHPDVHRHLLVRARGSSPASSRRSRAGSSRSSCPPSGRATC